MFLIKSMGFHKDMCTVWKRKFIKFITFKQKYHENLEDRPGRAKTGALTLPGAWI